MNPNMNFQQKLDKKLEEITTSGQTPTLLLHVCCAPCSSYVLEYLSNFFRITLFYYNPNITPKEEFDKRVKELNRFVREFPLPSPVPIRVGAYRPEEFERIAAGLEREPEGGARCYRCYEQRLTRTAELCRAEGFDYFTTTLSISPYKRADWLNEIGERLAAEYGLAYLTSDFKKRNGYQRSIQLSAEYGLYRQDYCGCRYSREERDSKRRNRSASGGNASDNSMKIL